MKVSIYIILSLLAAIQAHTLQRRALCWADYECGPAACCKGIGPARGCFRRVQEGGSCTIGLLHCGCDLGLKCKKTTILSWTCVKDD